MADYDKDETIKKIPFIPHDNEQTIRSRNKCGTGRANRKNFNGGARGSIWNKRDREPHKKCFACKNSKRASRDKTLSKFDWDEETKSYLSICKKCNKKSERAL